MNITVPVYIEQIPGKQGAPDDYQIRPLFQTGPGTPTASDERLSRATQRFLRSLRKVLERLGKEHRHDALAAWTFCPDLSDRTLKLEVQLRRNLVRCSVLIVSFRVMGRRVACTPQLPHFWWEVERKGDLEKTSRQVLTDFFRQQERDETGIHPRDVSITGKGWITTVDLDVQPAYTWKEDRQEKRLGIGEFEIKGGDEELHTIGRCLNFQYPDELDRAIFRDDEVAELARHLDGQDKRPVLLVGPRMTGKTAIIHEYAWRETDRRQSRQSPHHNVWQLSPQRLISGMMFVGQWENRLLAILSTARKRDLILYFDDLIGLFQAGKSANSALTVGDVLRQHMERRDVRILGEITPEALRVLQEADRGFADQFHIIPVREPAEADVTKILVNVQRQLEDRHRAKFLVPALPAVLDLQRRYVRDLSFPGKAAVFLRRLAIKYRRAEINRGHVLEEFQASSGLQLAFLDENQKLERQRVVDEIGRMVVGQQSAVAAAADAIGMAKARLNDTSRPMASFLFLGPTGVGKTQCARAIAKWLFGDDERLLRFDMNEYVSPIAAARLVGTFDEPEGLLTAAVRRQPFCVVLLDEIEKAHPDVFDMLLQVLGEGRLTDSLGRTVDFGNALIILTSNLGVREAEGRLAFREAEEAGQAVYVRAAERFFRPEFFNRLDRVIPFGRLDREQIGNIARLLINDVFRREGLLRRRVVLDVEPSALEHIVDAGFHPTLGARALKRAIERQLTRPVAAQLAGTTPDQPMAVTLLPGPDASVQPHIQTLDDALPVPRSVCTVNLDAIDHHDLLQRIEDVADDIEDAIAHHRPTGTITTDTVQPEHDHYFTVHERLESLRARIDELADLLDRPRGLALGLPRVDAGARRTRRARLGGNYRVEWHGDRNLMQGIHGAQDIEQFLVDLLANVSTESEEQAAVSAAFMPLLQDVALLHLMAQADPADSQGALLLLRAPRASAALGPLPSQMGRPFIICAARLGVEASAELRDREIATSGFGMVVLWRGTHALSLARMQAGTYLFALRDEIHPVRLDAIPLPADGDLAAAIRSREAAEAETLAQIGAGTRPVSDYPLAYGPVLRLIGGNGARIDLRTGYLDQSALSCGDRGWIERSILGALPLPDALFDDHDDQDEGGDA